MINKRLLIKKLLSYNDENSFYDKKQQLNLHTKEGKAKFIKHVCALSNANPHNNSFIVVGVEDATNMLLGVDFYDDSKIQNLINAYLNHPPGILYENIPFPRLPNNKVIGLVTIKPKYNNGIASFKKSILKYRKGYTYKRVGSNSALMETSFLLNSVNKNFVTEIEKSAKNNLKYTLEGVFAFMQKHKNQSTQYHVFKEQFVVCWSGIEKKVAHHTHFSRVDIEMVTEQIKLFYSSLDDIRIEYNEDKFIITEYILLGLNNNLQRYPLEKQIISFSENGSYKIESELIFTPPLFNQRTLHHLYNANNALLKKINTNVVLSTSEKIDITNLPYTYLILKLNGFTDAKQKLLEAKPYFKKHSSELYQTYKEVLRVFRKIKYQ